MKDYSNFDLIEYLEDRQIDYGISGSKDVGRGWIGINCPLPDCSDHGHHCGINRASKMFSCYICGGSGGIEYLISIIEHCSMGKARQIMAAYPLNNPEEEDLGRSRLGKRPIMMRKQIIPDEATKTFPPLHRHYLEKRNFDPDFLIQKYDLYSSYTIGRYRGRIIAPHFLNRRVVAFVARDVTGRSDIDDDCPKYMNYPEEESIIPVNRTLYNIDSVSEHGKGILVEGVVDVWRLGDGAFASCTANITEDQKLMIAKKKMKRLFVMYDPDAETKARKLAAELNIIVPTELIVLDSGDPGDLSPDEVRQIRRDLLK